ncbi:MULTISPECIES: hypothetical protein [unclassified Streptomyces]|uniref:hypothetical protein n=1 Tax=unclassified Streptomyces TaxID=2593676 RepID=UPI0013B62F7A|nr:hypothetical protein [Streptomyces sp. SID14446]NEB32853.1 hypothetical protein [Streptomyces sp. SID14446]
MAGLLAGASGATAVPAPSEAKIASSHPASPNDFRKHYFNTVIDQWSHWTPNTRTDTHAGTLRAGTNYFYCWTFAQTYANNGHVSPYWLRTDDDSGNRNVWVSDVNLEEWAFQNDTRILPEC